jgi:fatty acid desaturase
VQTQAKAEEIAVPRLLEAIRRSSQETAANDRGAGEYAELRLLLEKDDLFAPRAQNYILKIMLPIGLLVLSVGLLSVVQDFRLQVLDALLMAIACTQLAFLFHDAGHRQIFKQSHMNDALGLILANLLLGWSYNRWVTSHNKHHAHPNQPGLDPDISDVPVIAFTEEQARSKRGLSSFGTKFQAYCFPFLILLSAFSWRVRSIQFLWQNKVRHRSTEIVLLATHLVLYLGFIFFFLPVGKAILFVFCHNALFGLYVGSVFAASHKGMLYLDQGGPQSFLRHQILSTRNIRPHPLSNIWYGPMACHIEHHLFPQMPRTELLKARGIVKSFCLARGIPYHETGGLQSYLETFQYLHRVSAPLRETRHLARTERHLANNGDGGQ